MNMLITDSIKQLFTILFLALPKVKSEQDLKTLSNNENVASIFVNKKIQKTWRKCLFFASR